MRIHPIHQASLCIVLAMSCPLARLWARGPLTFEERVKVQEAIERVYYNHRIWPKENPQPKPPFEQMVPGAIIEAKVADYLKKCAALDKYWQRPITAEQLQAETDRMAKQSKDPVTLRELFAALGNDSYLIAECLARPILAERLSGPPQVAGRSVPAAASDFWASTSTGTGCPSARASHSAVWTGAEMIVWGGHADQNQSLDSGGCYTPATDSWVPMSAQTGVPSARSAHTAVWTGTEMIVWGGHDGYGNLFNTGGRYDPVSDTWTPTATGANVPAARMEHTAVWTGTEMIVWGGSVVEDPQGRGGRYNPASDAWSPVSTGAGSPEPRFYHSAVWTGTEMIVCGGSNDYDILATGGLYDPEKDSWTPMDLPEARYGQSAVWTGTEMILWGGRDAQSSVLNTGWRYDPATGAWEPTSTGDGVPDGRDSQTAVWTGSDMIIWGGMRDDLLNTGGRYTPASDAWAPTSTGTGVPEARYWHTAVWTGSAMIVWGGKCISGPLTATGGLYTPGSPPVPPTISAVKAATGPFRLTVLGDNFHSSAQILIDGTPVPTTVYKGAAKLQAKGGAALKAMVPKGTTVQIKVKNVDDGGLSAGYTFTR